MKLEQRWVAARRQCAQHGSAELEVVDVGECDNAWMIERESEREMMPVPAPDMAGAGACGFGLRQNRSTIYDRS